MSRAELSALAVSLEVSLAALALVVPLGLALAVWLARAASPGAPGGARSAAPGLRLRPLVEAVVLLPLVLPPVAVGVGLLLVFGRHGLGPWLERAGLPLVATWRGAAVASAVVALPVFVRVARAALEGVDPRLGALAATLGASPARVLATITLPLAGRGLLAATLLAFARALGEFGATMLVAGSVLGETQTLPLAIFEAYEGRGTEAALRLCAISAGVALLLALVASRLEPGAARTRREPAPAPPGAAAPPELTPGAGLRFALEVRRGDFTLALALEAPPGVTVLFGPSGSGKSTVLAALAGTLADAAVAGQATLGGVSLLDSRAGRALPPHARGLGLVPQEALLFPHRSVRANVLFGAKGRGLDPAIVSALELEPLLDRDPATLSGGERQRVALGRALHARPRALLLDEPLAALDRPRRARVAAAVADHARRAGIPVLYVTHALDEVLALGDRVCLLAGGRAVAVGRPAEVLAASASPLVAGLVGFETVLDLELVAGPAGPAPSSVARLGGALVPVAAVPGAARGPFGLRASDVLVAREEPRGLVGAIVLRARVEGAGESPALVRLRLADGNALVAALPAGTVAPGEEVFAVLAATALAPLDLAGAPAT